MPLRSRGFAMMVANSLPTAEAGVAGVTSSLRSWTIRLAATPPLGYLIRTGLLAAAYYAVARLGYQVGFSGPVAAIVWLPVGVAIAVLSLAGLRYWPGVLLGDLIANNYSALPVGAALGQTCGNMAEVLLAAYLIRRLARRENPLATVAGLARAFLAIAVGTAVSATVGPLSLLATHVITRDTLLQVSRTWWLGDTAGAIVVVPLAFAWFSYPPRGWTRHRWLETAVMLAAVAGVSELAFATDNPLTYLAFPPLIWAALRLDQQGATLAILIASAVVVWNTSHSAGPFHFTSITRSVLSAQLFIVVAALSTLFLTALVQERALFAERLGASAVRLADATDAERRRLERNLHDGAQQRLIALAIHLRLASEYMPQEAAQTADLQAAEHDLQIAIDELRDIAHGTHPAVLTNLGLAPAIRGVARRSTLPVIFVELPEDRVSEEAEAVAYYVFTEALANAQKHAHATSVSVRVVVVGPTLTIEIVDDGIGGAVEASGIGLLGLRARVEAVGGTFQLDSIPSVGTRLAASIPRSAPSVRTN